MDRRSVYFKGGIVIVSLFILFAVAELVNYFSDRTITKHGKKTSAHIFSVKMHIKPTLPRIEYYYLVKSDTIVSHHYVKTIINMQKLRRLEGTIMTVIYDTTDVKSNRLLINVDDFK